MNKINKYSTGAPKTPEDKKRPSPNQPEEEEQMISKPPKVSPVRTEKGKTATNAMDLDNKGTAAKVPEDV